MLKRCAVVLLLAFCIACGSKQVGLENSVSIGPYDIPANCSKPVLVDVQQTRPGPLAIYWLKETAMRRIQFVKDVVSEQYMRSRGYLGRRLTETSGVGDHHDVFCRRDFLRRSIGFFLMPTDGHTKGWVLMFPNRITKDVNKVVLTIPQRLQQSGGGIY